MKKRVARIASGRLVADSCPNCMHLIDGVTGASLDEPFERIPTGRISIKGSATMCCYCGAMLVFADEEGHLRVMTETERANFRMDPVLENVIRKMRDKLDFTKKTYRGNL